MKEQNKWVTVYRYPADSPKTWKELWLAATPVVGGPDSPLVDVLSVGNDAKWLVQFLNRGQIFQARIQRRSIQSNTILHVYHGTCKKCGGQYVGESTRKFKQRHSGHKQVKRKYGGLGHHYGGDVWRWLCRHVRQKIFRSCWWGDERTVQRAQTVSEDPHRREWKYLFLFLPPLFKTTEGVVVGFQIFAWVTKIGGFQ